MSFLPDILIPDKDYINLTSKKLIEYIRIKELRFVLQCFQAAALSP